MNKVYKFLLAEFIYNGHLQALGAAGIVLVSSVLLIGQTSIALVFICYFLFEIIYLFDRFLGFNLDSSTNIERSAHLSVYLNKVPMLMILMSVALGILLAFTSLTFFVFSLIVLGFGFLYPILFKNFTKIIFLFKNLYVSFVHGLLVVYTAIFFGLDSFVYLSNKFYLLFFVVFIEALMAQIALDMKDTKQDRQEGLKTLPAQIGMEGAIKIMRGILIPVFLLFSVTSYVLAGQSLVVLVFVSLLVNWYGLNLIEANKKLGYLLFASKFFLWLLIASSGFLTL